MTYQFINLRVVSRNTQQEKFILPWDKLLLETNDYYGSRCARERLPSLPFLLVKCIRNVSNLSKTSAGDHYGTAGRWNSKTRERVVFLHRRGLYRMFLMRRVRELRATEVYPLLHLTHLEF